jgi:acetyl-CoA carboxylase carboxyl transferase subunit alpha
MWRDAAKRDLAAQAMKITAPDLLGFGIIDAIVPEPEGGAHTDHARMGELLGNVLAEQLAGLKKLTTAELLDARYKKFRNISQFYREA